MATSSASFEPPAAGVALTPDAHEVALAIASRRQLGALAQTTGDMQITVTAESGATGQMQVPASVVRLLFTALSEIACGNAVSLLPMTAELTTQQAADILNVSRPYLVGLLEKGDISFRKVGVQRRVRLQELMDYKRRSDIDRRAALDGLTRQAQELRLGYDE